MHNISRNHPQQSSGLPPAMDMVLASQEQHQRIGNFLSKKSAKQLAPSLSSTSSSASATMVADLTDMREPTHPKRQVLRAAIEYELRVRFPTRPDWQKNCNTLAVQLEDLMYHSAPSLDEYQDKSTIINRLAAIALSKKVEKTLASASPTASPSLNRLLFEKAKFGWLEPTEVDYLFRLCGIFPPADKDVFLTEAKKNPLLSGKLFHLFSDCAIDDGKTWILDQDQHANAEIPYDLVLSSSVNGQPKVWMVQSREQVGGELFRRIYWSVEYEGNILAHYMHNSRVVKMKMAANDANMMVSRRVLPKPFHSLLGCCCLECQCARLAACDNHTVTNPASSSMPRDASQVLSRRCPNSLRTSKDYQQSSSSNDEASFTSYSRGAFSSSRLNSSAGAAQAMAALSCQSVRAPHPALQALQPSMSHQAPSRTATMMFFPSSLISETQASNSDLRLFNPSQSSSALPMASLLHTANSAVAAEALTTSHGNEVVKKRVKLE